MLKIKKKRLLIGLIAVLTTGIMSTTAASAATTAPMTAAQKAKVLQSLVADGASSAMAQKVTNDPSLARLVPVTAKLSISQSAVVPATAANVKSPKVLPMVETSSKTVATSTVPSASTGAPNVRQNGAVNQYGPYPNIGCRWIASNWTTYNGYGQWMYRYTLNKYWCWGYPFVNYMPPHRVDVSISGLGGIAWAFHGNYGGGEMGLNPISGGYTGTQSYDHGHFTLCFIKVGCVASEHITAIATGWNNGTANVNTWK